jgi:ATP-dependent protease ClpP protease subunit
MTHYPARRGLLLCLASIAVPSFANGQAPPSPPAAPPTTSPPLRPLPPIDKTKCYYAFFDQAIDLAAAKRLRQQLAGLVDAGVSDITLVVDSPGGLLEAALITYSFIRSLPVKVKTHAQGFVASAATLLFLAGEERSADRSARFLFHPSQFTLNGVMTEAQIREGLDGLGTIADVTTGIYRERTRLQAAEIERFSHETIVYTAEQARAAGVVETVADLRIPGEAKARMLFLD